MLKPAQSENSLRSGGISSRKALPLTKTSLSAGIQSVGGNVTKLRFPAEWISISKFASITRKPQPIANELST